MPYHSLKKNKNKSKVTTNLEAQDSIYRSQEQKSLASLWCAVVTG